MSETGFRISSADRFRRNRKLLDVTELEQAGRAGWRHHSVFLTDTALKVRRGLIAG